MGKIYLIYGEDEYLKQKTIKEIQKETNVEDSINSLIMVEPSWEEIFDEVTLPAFLSPNKLVIIHDSDIFKEVSKKEIADPNLPSPTEFFERIISDEEYEEEILDGLNIVFVTEGKKINKANKVYKMFSKESGKTKGKKIIEIIECNKLMPLEVQKLLLKKSKEMKVNIDSKEIRYLLEIVENNTYTQMNEFLKICFLNKALNGEKIEKDDIDMTCIKNEESVIYTITDHIIAGRKLEALRMVDIFIESGNGLSLLGYIYKYFRNIYITGLSINEKTESTIHLALGLKQNQKFLVKKYIEVAKKLGIRKIKFILKELVEIDERFKTGDENAPYMLKNIINLV